MEPQNPNPNQPTPIDPMQAIAGVPPVPTAATAATSAPAATAPVATPAAEPAAPATEPAAAPSAAEQQMVAELEASRLAEEEQARIAAEKAAIEQANAAAAASQSKGKGMMIGLICAIVVAVVGIAFGVIMMLNGNSQADSLNKQIASLKQTNSNLQSQLEGETLVVTTPNGEELELDPVTADSTADYIYIGEWGIKIAIPEALKSVSYQLTQGANYTGLSIWGVDCYNPGQCQYFPNFADARINTGSLGFLTRYPNTYDGYTGNVVFSDEEYMYVYNIPGTFYSEDETERSWETSSAEIIKTMLTDTDNYSAI